MSTALFFALPYKGHIHPTLPVIEELVRRGERVLAYTTDEFRPMLGDVGAEFRLFPHTQSDTNALVTMVHWQLKVASNCMEQLVREARTSQAEYVLVDTACHWGYALARHLSLPVIALHSTFPAAFQNISYLQSILLDLRRAPSVLPTVVRFLVLDRLFARRWHVPPLVSPIALVQPREALAHLVLTHPSMRPDGDYRDYHFVGPCLRQRGCTRGESMPPADGRPLVYVSLGTIWSNRPDFYRLCVEAFRDSPYQVLISTGTSAETGGHAALPENIHVRRQVDQIEALERAAVFVSHGGMNSLSEALHAGVPLVLFPQANDQFPLSALMERWGVGIQLPHGTPSAEAIRTATAFAANDPLIRSRCQDLRAQMRAAGNGAVRAANLIFEALQRSRSQPTACNESAFHELRDQSPV